MKIQQGKGHQRKCQYFNSIKPQANCKSKCINYSFNLITLN